METKQRYQPRLVGVAVGVLLALLIWPATGWIVRSQMALTIPVPAVTAPWTVYVVEKPRAYHDAAVRHPQDFELQLADATLASTVDEPITAATRLKHLHELIQRFPDQAALYATTLRVASLGLVYVHRDETLWLDGDPIPASRATVNALENTPEQLAAFDRDAAAGERLDPENAYFPFMRAVGLFAAHRDAEALDALKRAARKPNWWEYFNAELEGKAKLHEATYGTSSALIRTMQAASILFPHYAQLRSVGRIAVSIAAQAEQAGHIEEGLSIREAVRECGSKMRVQSPALIGNLVGIAIAQTSLARPAGAPPIKQTHSGADGWLREAQGRAFDAFLQRNGHPEQIARIHAESAAGVETRELIQLHAADHAPFDATVERLAGAWAGGTLLLSVAMWMLALGGAAALLGRCRWMRTAQGLPGYARRGMALGLFACPMIAGALMLSADSPAAPLLLVGLALCAILSLVTPGLTGPERWRSGGVFLLTLTVVSLLGAAFACQLRASAEPLAHALQYTMACANNNLDTSISMAAVAAGAVVPLLTLLTLGAISLVCRVPLTVGLVRGLRGCAVPIACILLLAYGLLVPFTLRQENIMGEGLKRTLQHEGRFIAELNGKEWPGPTH